MPKRIDSELSSVERARLRKTYGAESTEEYQMVLSLLGMIVHQYEQYGVINLPHAMILLQVGFLDFWNYERDDQVAEFEVVEITPRFLRAMRKVYNETVGSEPNINISAEPDPYLRDFDEFGDIAEDNPKYRDTPKYAAWGESCFLMTKERLDREINSGDWNRLLHRTPYRPMKLSS